MRRLLASLPFALLLAFPLLEVGAHARTRANVPTSADYAAAAAFIRAALQPRDLIVAAPEWTDPLLREQLGDRIDLAMAGRSDSANYERLWALSIRGARPAEAPAEHPALSRRFGKVTVLRWALQKSPVLYHFPAHVGDARVARVTAQGTKPCDVRRHRSSVGGGLGVGVLPPRDRIGCEGAKDGVWVAPVVMEDLWLRPRYCVLQPAAERGVPLRVTFDDVPLGDELVFHGGLYYEDERMRTGAPVQANILLDGRLAGTMTHRDGDGWKRMTMPTTTGLARVEVEVSSAQASKRRFCWDASTRRRTP